MDFLSNAARSVNIGIQSVVSQNRKRIELDDYNLDLSYVVPFVLAMGLPTSGLETVIRNNLKQVSV